MFTDCLHLSSLHPCNAKMTEHYPSTSFSQIHECPHQCTAHVQTCQFYGCLHPYSEYTMSVCLLAATQTWFFSEHGFSLYLSQSCLSHCHLCNMLLKTSQHCIHKYSIAFAFAFASALDVSRYLQKHCIHCFNLVEARASSVAAFHWFACARQQGMHVNLQGQAC